MTAETSEDFGAAPDGPAARWKAEVRAFEREREPWCKRVDAIEKRYRDERSETDTQRRFALLWANIEVLQPTLYARDPTPEVSRRFKDRDPTGRVMALLLERNLTCAIEQGRGAFGRTIQSCVLDYLLGGQGVAWVRYEVKFGPEPAELGQDNATETNEDGAAEAAEVGPPVATSETVHLDYVHWRDFGFTAGARVWDEVTCVWRRSFLDRTALRERFPEVADRIPLDHKTEGDEPDGTFAKASIYEIWDSATRTVRWLHKGMPELLDERPYPLKISGHFPCPAPLFGTLTNGSMTPVPDFVQYQDQARELDDLTARIAALTKGLRLLGFTPGDTSPSLMEALSSDGEAKIVPIPSWSAFGGQKLVDLLVWLPIREVAQTLEQLHALRQRVKDDAYEITGLSDILRGSTKATETATAQQLKAQWGGVRVRNRQTNVQRFAAEALGLMAEVMVGHFDAERLAEQAGAGYMLPADQQLVPDALMALTGDNALVHYRVDVETDSTIEMDRASDKAAWSELLTGVASFMTAMLPVMQGVAAAAPQAAAPMAAMVGEMLTGAVRRFKAGPAVETAIEAAFEALGQAASQPPPQAQQAGPPPDPMELAKVQAEQERTQLQTAMAQDESQHRTADRAIEQQRLQLDAAKVTHAMQMSELRPAGVPA